MAGVRCVECGSDQSEVIDSRPGPNKVRRRRRCTNCFRRFTTEETVLKPSSRALHLSRKKVLELRAMKLTYKEIAKRAGVSVTTVWLRANE